jgi:hypothetical protein
LTHLLGAVILVDMKRIAFFFALFAAVVCVGLAQPSTASAGWCWPNCSDYGMLGPGTTTWNGCWYSGSEVCSGWGYFYLNGVKKSCYPCDSTYPTSGKILYGFENSARIRGNFTMSPNTLYVRPSDLGMGGYLRAQVTWWSGTSSQINVAAAG